MFSACNHSFSLLDGACDDYTDGRVCKIRFDANGATGSGSRDPTQVKLLPGRHMLFPPLERVHYLQVRDRRTRLHSGPLHHYSTHRAPWGSGEGKTRGRKVSSDLSEAGLPTRVNTLEKRKSMRPSCGVPTLVPVTSTFVSAASPGLTCSSSQVPLSRRLSHDDTNIFSTPRAPGSFLHKWSSSDDIRILPAQSRALGGPPEYLGQRHRLEDEEDEEEAEGGGLASLRQFLESGVLGSGGGPPRGPGFFREEITTFIDETPLPSPTASPGPSPRRPRPLGFSPRRLSLGSPDSRAVGLPLGLSAGRRCSLTGSEGSSRAWGRPWGPGNPIFPQLTL